MMIPVRTAPIPENNDVCIAQESSDSGKVLLKKYERKHYISGSIVATLGVKVVDTTFFSWYYIAR